MKFNPIKWSTKKLQKLQKFIETEGTVPRNNPFADGDINYKKRGIKWSYTKEEMLSMAKIKKDIFYFAEEIASVMTDQKGITQLKNVGGLRDYQKSVLLDLVRYRFNIYLASRQIGKCVDPMTIVKVKIGNDILSLPIWELYNMVNKINPIKKILYKILFKTTQNQQKNPPS